MDFFKYLRNHKNQTKRDRGTRPPPKFAREWVKRHKAKLDQI